MTVLVHTAFLCVEWVRGCWFYTCCPPEAWEVHRWPTGTLSQKSMSPDFSLHWLQSLQFPHIWLETQVLQLETDTHVLTSNWKKYWDVFGFLGSSWKTKTGRGPSMSGIICKNHPGLSQDSCSKVESLYYTFNWKSALMGLFQSPSLGLHWGSERLQGHAVSSKTFLESLPDISKKVPAISRSNWALGAFLKVQIFKKKHLWAYGPFHFSIKNTWLARTL